MFLFYFALSCYHRLTSKTAILIFACNSSQEAENKTFLKDLSTGKNYEIASYLNHQVELVSKKSGIPYFIFDESLQHGDKFGERLFNAFEEVSNKGYEQIIAIGNDCLDLHEDDLRIASAALKDGRPVLGPCHDGGVYLIGLSVHQINCKLKTSIDWQSHKVFEQLLSLFGSDSLQLAFKYDLDNPLSIRVAKLSEGLQRLWKLIISLLNEVHLERPTAINSEFEIIRIGLRGPPFRHYYGLS